MISVRRTVQILESLRVQFVSKRYSAIVEEDAARVDAAQQKHRLLVPCLHGRFPSARHNLFKLSHPAPARRTGEVRQCRGFYGLP